MTVVSILQQHRDIYNILIKVFASTSFSSKELKMEYFCGLTSLGQEEHLSTIQDQCSRDL
jgi:hypothetical protein